MRAGSLGPMSRAGRGAYGGRVYHNPGAGECNNCATDSRLTFWPARASGAFAVAFRPRSARRLGQVSHCLHSCGISGRTNSSGRTRGAGGAARAGGIEKGRVGWRSMRDVSRVARGRGRRLPRNRGGRMQQLCNNFALDFSAGAGGITDANNRAGTR